MKRLIITLIIASLLVPAVAIAGSTTELILKLNAIAPTCPGVLAEAATMSQAIWQKGNPEASKVESFLPNVNSPCLQDPADGNFYVTVGLKSYEIEGWQAIWAATPKPHALVNSAVLMTPDPETGELPLRPFVTITRGVEDENGNPTGETHTYTMEAGRIQ